MINDIKILAIDVDYSDDNYAIVAGVAFNDWQQENADAVFKSRITPIHKYIPGQFYLRELPCIQALLNEHKLTTQLIIIDGHVFLDSNGKPGLGAYLFESLKQKTPVIGVAKKAFKSTPTECAIYRGKSERPLFVSTAGLPLDEAKHKILRMHGKHRLPTLLKLADRLCRNHDIEWDIILGRNDGS